MRVLGGSTAFLRMRLPWRSSHEGVYLVRAGHPDSNCSFCQRTSRPALVWTSCAGFAISAGLPDNFSMLLDDEIEILHPDLPRGRFRSVLFDFDGTLSLIREGWPQVMIPMMVDVLRQTGTSEDTVALTAAVEEFVMRLNGRQTIYQMIQLADAVRQRG